MRLTLPTHDKAAELELIPRESALDDVALDTLCELAASRLTAILPDPFGQLRSNVSSSKFVAKFFGVVALVGSELLWTTSRTPWLSCAYFERVEHGKNLGAFAVTSAGDTDCQRHTVSVNKRVDEYPLAFEPVFDPLAAAFTGGKRSRRYSTRSSQSCL